MFFFFTNVGTYGLRFITYKNYIFQVKIIFFFVTAILTRVRIWNRIHIEVKKPDLDPAQYKNSYKINTSERKIPPYS